MNDEKYIKDMILISIKRLPILWEQAASPPVPRPTPRTTPNRTSDGSRTVAQIRHKLPIGYNGASHIRPPKLPTPVDRSPNLTNCLIRGLPSDIYQPKRHPYPISRFATIHWTDR